MNWIRISLWYFGFSLFLFFLGDLAFTKLIGLSDPYANEKRYRIKHSYYHHTFSKNYQGRRPWGIDEYYMCTDEHGFKVSCSQNTSSGNSFDIVFIGDSFTEAIGMPYENSFVGMFASNYPKLRVANLGVTSYSPSIYLNKIESTLSEGLRFNHVVVFIDISDIQDEAFYYRKASNGSIYTKSFKDKNQTLLFIQAKKFVKRNFHLFWYEHLRTKELVFDEDKGLKRRSEWTHNAKSEYYGELGVDGAVKKAVYNMTQLHELLLTNGIKLSVGVYPWPEQLKYFDNDENRQEKIWREFCDNRCEMFINVFPDFNDLVESIGVDETYNRFFIEGDVHFNKYGNEIIFRELKREYENLISVN
ncbi:MAG: hypothetical protein HKN83_04415 [Gammaproteobacteria bacterium]|nr:hypothetical protein [Gammaproteobacteria bacterium]